MYLNVLGLFTLAEVRPMFGLGMNFLFKSVLKVSKFQNEFMKSSSLPKYEPNIVRISALYCATLQGRNPYTFLIIFWEK